MTFAKAKYRVVSHIAHLKQIAFLGVMSLRKSVLILLKMTLCLLPSLGKILVSFTAGVV